MAFIDYYKVMGIPKDTPQKDIKAAFRKRSKQFHPDLHPDDPKAQAKFKLLNEANEVLSDPEKRAKYDQYGENWKQADAFGGGGGRNPFGEGFNPFGGGADFSSFGGGGAFSSFFQQMFGGMGDAHSHRTRQSHRPEPTEVEAHASIDVWQAMLGGEIIATTPYGKFKLKIAPGTQPGKKLRLKGKGGLTSSGVARDLIVVFDIVIPTTLSDKQKALVEEASKG